MAESLPQPQATPSFEGVNLADIPANAAELTQTGRTASAALIRLERALAGTSRQTAEAQRPALTAFFHKLGRFSGNLPADHPNTAQWQTRITAIRERIRVLLAPPLPLWERGANLVLDHPLASTAVVAGTVHTILSNTAPNVQDLPDAVDVRTMPNLAAVMKAARFNGASDTGEITDRLIDFYSEVFADETPGNAYFYDCYGNVLLEVELPENWTSFNQEQKNTWLNDMRKKISGDRFLSPSFDADGYPFVSIPINKFVDPEDSFKNSLLSFALENLRAPENRVRDGRYFNNQEVSLEDAIRRISDVYDVPYEIALGVGAQESLFEQKAASSAAAHGIYQITADAFTDAVAMSRMFDTGSIRSGAIRSYREDRYNRLVNMEMFCAYYRFLWQFINPSLDLLEKRLRTLDPSFSRQTVAEMAILTTYNAGVRRVPDVIKAFVALSDGEIKKHIGEPPYGLDVWLGVIASHFGDDRVGKDVFEYAIKVLARGAAILGEGSFVEERMQEKDGTVSRRGLFSRFLHGASGVGSVVAGVALGAQVVRQNPRLDRRTLVRGGVAAFAVGTPFFGKTPDKELPEEPVVDLPKGEHYHAPNALPDVIAPATHALDALYLDLALRKQILRTPREQNHARQYNQKAQERLLRPAFAAAWGEDFVDEFEDTKHLPTRKRERVYRTAAEKHSAHIARALKDGTVVAMSPDGRDSPYFPEQVGRNSGTSNDPNALFMHKEFESIIATVVALVNHQIDLFNANPAAYDMPHFPTIPHISSIKVSGAARSPLQTYRMLTGGQGGRTTKGLSSHWLLQAIDLGSYATANSHMVRFAEDMRDEQGTVVIPAGGKLPSSGFGKKTRQILSIMIGRALFAMEDPMRTKGVTLMPLWEGGQKNWHLAISML